MGGRHHRGNHAPKNAGAKNKVKAVAQAAGGLAHLKNAAAGPPSQDSNILVPGSQFYE